MRIRNSAPLVVAVVLALGACTTALPPEETEALGGPFNEAVKEGYVQLAAAEWGDVDVPAARHFRRKARDAMVGDVVWPDKVGSRKVPTEYQREAVELRERLVAVLESSARETAPVEAALAQVNFDCWLKELTRAPRGDAAVACKDAFLTNLVDAEASLPPPEPFTVFFDEGSDRLDQQGRAVVENAADLVERVDPARIDVLGYADTFGPASQNQEIAQRRARAVANALVGAGVPSGLINAEGRGEATISPIQRENRRAEIVFGE